LLATMLLIDILRTWLFTIPVVAVLTAIGGTLSLMVSLVSSTGRWQHEVARVWARVVLFVSGVKVTVEGLEKIPPGGSFVFIANHRSFYDIPLVLPWINVQVRFLAKKSLFSVPFLGTHLKRAGHLVVNHSNARESLRTMSDAARVIQEREVSILLFPEGGRTYGDLEPFKDGAAYIAIKAGVPVIPIGLIGAGKILGNHGRIIRPGHVRMRIGDPIYTIDLTLADLKPLTHQMEERIGELIGQKVVAPATESVGV